MLQFTKKEKDLLKKLNTPAKVQDFLNGLKFNFEEHDEFPQGQSSRKLSRKLKKKETLKSPLFTLRVRKAHCLEGALLGAYILSLHKFTPYLLHLKTTKNDFDHVVAPFKISGLWGALSKTNHAVLRYREPIYRNVRELVMSYFHEYFLDDGKKTLRQYSKLLNLNTFEKNWATLEGDLWGIDQELDRIKHFSILQKTAIVKLRKADEVEIKAGKVVEFKSF